MQIIKPLTQVLKHPTAAFISTLIFSTFIRTTGFCDDVNEQAINDMSKNISEFLFGSTIRKIALTLGMGAGLFQAFMSGSIRPLLIYGGLGLAVCYLPKIVNWISSIG
ncbi:MAG TPA: hypothetical protein VLE95_06630 [Chlamydiales bacterium]|nr:hypothetical protein [Chlamydiales bacterium]